MPKVLVRDFYQGQPVEVQLLIERMCLSDTPAIISTAKVVSRLVSVLYAKGLLDARDLSKITLEDVSTCP